MASRTALSAAHRPRPLLVTDDPALLDEVLNIAADVSVDVDVANDPAAARVAYPSAPLVLIGDAAAPLCARAGLPSRPGVALITYGDRLEHLWPHAEALGAEQIVQLPEAVCWLIDRFVEVTRSVSVDSPAGPFTDVLTLPGALGDRSDSRSGQAFPADKGDTGRVIAVLGGRGGAGASVLAAGLAVTAGRAGLRSLLVDADPLGGGVDLVLGWERIKGVRWPALAETSGTVDPPTLVSALPRRGDVAVLSCDRTSPVGLSVSAMRAAVDAGRRGCDLVVADLPRRLDDAAVLALGAADLALLVVPAELRACVAAARVAAVVATHTDVLHLVVRGPAPGRLRADEIARSLRLPVAGTLRPEPDLARRLERGVPPAGTGRGPLAALCRRIIADLGLTGRVTAA